MVTILSSDTVPQILGLTRPQLFQRLARATGLLTYGTATGGGRDTLIDTTRLQSHQLSTGDNIGAWLRVASTTDGLAPVGEIRTVTGYKPDLGTLTVNPNFTASVESGDTYELWRVDPSLVLDMVDSCLTDDLYMPCWTILSEVSDYDMEQPGTTDWTEANATVAKSSAEPRASLYGKRYLTVAATSALGYARSNLLYVEPGKTYHCSAVARSESAGTTARLVLYDEVNGVVLQSWDSSRLQPARVWFTWLVPSGCHTVSLRLTTVESGKTTDWDEVCFYPLYAQDIALPWWVKTANQVKGIFQLNPLRLSQNIWDSQLAGERDARWDKTQISFGRGQLRALARIGLLDSFPVFMLGARNETSYASDTEVKLIDPGLFVACVKYRLYEYLSQPLVTGVLDAANIKDKLPAAYQDYMTLQQEFATNLNTTIGSPTPAGYFLDPRFTFGAN